MTLEDCLPLPRKKMANAGTIIISGIRDHYQTHGRKGNVPFAGFGLSMLMIVRTATNAHGMSSGTVSVV